MRKPKRLTKKQIQEDIDAFAALQAVAGYAPSNADFSLANATASHAAMEASQTDEVQKQAALDAARDAAADDEWAFHNLMLGVKTQIKAQFGADSDELQAIGLKKKSEYKKPSGRKPSDDTP